MAETGQATFRAIADFSRLRKEAKGSARELRRTRSAAEDLGEQLAETEKEATAAAKALSEAQEDLTRSGKALSRARDREADAAGRLRVAEQRLLDLRESGTATATQLVKAEEDLAKAERGLYTAQQQVIASTRDLDRANQRVEVSTRRVERAQLSLGQASESSARKTGLLRRAMRSVGDESSRFGRLLDGIGKRLPGTIRLIGKLTAALGAAALAASAMHAGAAGIMSMVGAVAALSGAIGLLPAVGLAGAAAMGALKIGTSGFGDAIKAVQEGDLEKFNESLKNLTPAARDAARALWELRPQFQELRDSVQEDLFHDLGRVIRDLGNRYLPILEIGLSRVASSFNDAAHEVAEFLMSAEATRDVETIMSRIGDAFSELEGVGRDVTEIFLDLAEVGSEFLAPLAGDIADATDRFKDFIDEARKSGDLKDWIAGGIDAVKTLGSVVKNVGGIIGGVFKASSADGTGFLDTLDTITGRMSAWVNSMRGQSALRDFFASASQAAETLAPILVAIAEVVGSQIAPVLADIAERIGPGVEKVIRGLGTAFEEAGPALDRFFAAVGKLLGSVGDLGPLVGELAAGVADVLTPAVEALAWALERLADWFNALPEPMQNVVGQIGAFVLVGGGLLLLLGKLVTKGKAVAGAMRGAAEAIGLMKKRSHGMAAADAAGELLDGGGDGRRGRKGRRGPPVAGWIRRSRKAGSAAGEAAKKGFLSRLGSGLKSGMSRLFAGAVRVLPRLGVWGLVAAAAVGVGYAIYQNWDKITGWVSQKWSWLEKNGWTTWNGIAANVGLASQRASQWIQQKWGQATSYMSRKVGEAADWVGMKFGQARDWAAARSSEAANWVSRHYTDAKNWVTQKVNQAATAVGNGFTRARDAATRKATEARNWVSDRYNQAANWVRDHANRAADAAGRAFNRARDWVSGAAATARDRVGSAFAGMRDRVSNFAWDAASSARNAFDDLVSAARSAWNRVSSIVSNIGSSISSVASRGWNWATSWFSTGGWVGGTGNKDTVHGMLTPDEYVVRQERARRWGPLLEVINSSASSGQVLKTAAATAGGGGGAQALMANAAGGAAVAPRIAALGAMPSASYTAGGATGGAGLDVSITQNIYNPAPETPSESLTRRMRRTAELGLRESLDRRN